MRYLFSIDMPWSEWHTRASDSIGRGFCFEIVVHDIQKHGNEEQNKTACASLDTSEFVCYWSRKDREPEMILGDFVVCSLGENIGKFLFLKIMRHEQHAFDLFKKKNHCKSLQMSREQTFPSSFSTANHRWQMKSNFSMVCRSRTMIYFRNQDADLPEPLLSCQTRR